MENSTSTETQEENNIVHPGTGEPDATERTPLEQDENLSIGDFFNARNGVQENANPPSEEEEVKKEEAVKEAPEAKQTTEVAAPAKLPSREEQLKEYGITDEKLIQAFKRMPNESFAYLKTALDKQKTFDTEVGKYKTELEQIKSKKQDPHHPTLYNHPQGYVLNPEYNKLTAAYQTANGVLRHWTSQLAKIRRGEKWLDLTANAQGQIQIENDAKEPDADSEVRVMEELEAAREYSYDYKKKLGELETGHTNRRKQDEQYIKEQEEKFFPGYSDPKHETQQAQQKFKEMLPDTMQEYVPTSIFVKTVVNNAIFAKQLADKDREIAQLKAGKGTPPPPKSKFLTNGSASSKSVNSMQDDDITIDDFHRARSGVR